MTIVQSMPTEFKTGLLSCAHNFNTSNRAVVLNTVDVFYIALYDSSATLDNTTLIYDVLTPGQITNTSGSSYVAGGIALTIATTPTGDTVANAGYISFSPAVWTIADFTTRGALIYNSSNGNLAVAVLNFGVDKTVSGGGTFTITFPTYATNTTVAAVQLS
jgi:hypothetical protein